MISGPVPFYEIIQSVKDETGIENLRPHYEKIRRLIFRAEREIGYGGSVVIKKKVYIFNKDYAGKYFPFPEDFIELEGIGIDSCPIPQCSYQKTTDGIRFNKQTDKDIVLLYWGLSVDTEGNPITTRNHEEAVVAYVVWKLYSPKIFLGIGNMNAAKNYEQEFVNLLLESRGDDAFPTLEEWNDIGALSYTDRRILLEEGVHRYDYTIDYEDPCDFEEEEVDIHYWQLDNTVQTITDVIPLVNPTYLETIPFDTFTNFKSGVRITYVKIARIAFALIETENLDYIIMDQGNVNVTSLFETYYYDDTKIKLYVSKNIISHSTMEFKFKI
jgi:hypothetical protein